MTDRTLPLGVAGAGRDRSLLGRLNGPQTIGRGPAFWSGFVLAVLIAVAYPFFADGWTVGNTAYFFTWTFMAMGLCLIWGYTGALSFRADGVLRPVRLRLRNPDDQCRAPAYGFTFAALAIAVALSALLAGVLGYFLF